MPAQPADTSPPLLELGPTPDDELVVSLMYEPVAPYPFPLVLPVVVVPVVVVPVFAVPAVVVPVVVPPFSTGSPDCTSPPHSRRGTGDKASTRRAPTVLESEAFMARP
jgi:hypothetical protein